jgi:hypothetical protein
MKMTTREEAAVAKMVMAAAAMETTAANDRDGDTLNTQQTPEYTKDKYNVKIVK